MNFLISGYYGFKNTGDELILSRIINDLKNMYRDSKILLVSGDVEYSEKVHKVEAINRFSPYEVEEAVKWCDVAIVGGGGLIQEYFGIDIKNIFENFGYGVASYSIIPLLSKIHEKPVFYWSHGVGPIFSEYGKKFCKWFYTLSDYTTIRDKYSYLLLKNIYMDIKNVYVDVDPCMVLDLEKLARCKYNLKEDRLKIGINVRPWFGEDKIIETIAMALNNILKKNNNMLIVPVPFDLKFDIDTLNKLFSLLPKKNTEIKYLKELRTPFEVVSLVKEIDLFIGMRLHSIIVAHMLKKPTLALIYDKKVELAAMDFGIVGIPLCKLNISNLIKFLDNLIGGKIKSEHNKLFTYNTPKIFCNFLKKGEISEAINETQHSKVIIKNEKFYECFIQSLKNEIQQIRNTLDQTQKNIEKILQEKQELFDRLEKINEYCCNLNILKNEIEKKLKQTQKEFREISRERDELYKTLSNIYSSRFWKIASFYYRLKSSIVLILKKFF